MVEFTVSMVGIRRRKEEIMDIEEVKAPSRRTFLKGATAAVATAAAASLFGCSGGGQQAGDAQAENISWDEERAYCWEKATANSATATAPSLAEWLCSEIKGRKQTCLHTSKS